MEKKGKLFGGILLLALGMVIIYQSFILHLKEFFTLIGIILGVIGLFLIISSIVSNINRNSKNKNSKNLSKQYNKKNIEKNNKAVNNVKTVRNSANSKPVLKTPKDNPNTPQKKLKFTPNYERPTKVNRKPKKKSEISDEGLIDVSNVPDISKIPKVNKSKEIFKALDNNEDSQLNPDFQNIQNINTEETGTSAIDEINEFKNLYDGNIQEKSFKIKNNSSINPDISESYVFSSKGIMTSQETFEELIKNAKKELLLEIPSIKSISNKAISKLSKLNTRIIIQEFDIKDMSYILLVISLVENGVNIKTMNSINTINLIADDKQALIISNNDVTDESEIGAIFTDNNEIQEIKNVFEKTWKLANKLDLKDIT